MIDAPSAADAPSKVPVRVLISGNSFQDGAAILFTGSLPPNSNVTISFNTFVTSTTNTHMTYRITSVFVTVIAFADVVPIVLNEGAYLSADYNDIRTDSGTTLHSIPFVVGAMTFNRGSAGRVANNVIRSYGALPTCGNTWVLLFDVTQYIVGTTTDALFRYYSGGSWAFEDNWMDIATQSDNFALVGNSPRIVEALGGGSYTVTGNYIRSTPLTTTEHNIFWTTDGNVVTDFTYRFDSNVFEAYGNSHSTYSLSIAMSGSSLLSFSNNSFISAGPNTANYAGLGLTYMYGSSRAIVNGNTFVTKIGATRGRHAFLLWQGMIFADSTILSFVGNSIDAADRTNFAYKLVFVNGIATNIAPTARIIVCDLQYYGAPLRQRLELQRGVDSNFFALPFELCPVTASHTLQPSSSPTLLESNSLSTEASVSESATNYRSSSASAAVSVSLSDLNTATGTPTPSQITTKSEAVPDTSSQAVTSTLSESKGTQDLSASVSAPLTGGSPSAAKTLSASSTASLVAALTHTASSTASSLPLPTATTVKTPTASNPLTGASPSVSTSQPPLRHACHHTVGGGTPITHCHRIRLRR